MAMYGLKSQPNSAKLREFLMKKLTNLILFCLFAFGLAGTAKNKDPNVVFILNEKSGQ